MNKRSFWRMPSQDFPRIIEKSSFFDICRDYRLQKSVHGWNGRSTVLRNSGCGGLPVCDKSWGVWNERRAQ